MNKITAQRQGKSLFTQVMLNYLLENGKTVLYATHLGMTKVWMEQGVTHIEPIPYPSTDKT